MDTGGTSFDVGLITEGHYPTRWDQSLAQFMVNIPMTAMDTIGSGTGSYVRVDGTSERIEVGPDSAGYKVGYSNMDSDVDTVTATDCTLALGDLNPGSFLGGDIPMDHDVATSSAASRRTGRSTPASASARTRPTTGKSIRSIRRHTPSGRSNCGSGSVPAVSPSSTWTPCRRGIPSYRTSNPTSTPSTRSGRARRRRISASASTPSRSRGEPPSRPRRESR